MTNKTDNDALIKKIKASFASDLTNEDVWQVADALQAAQEEIRKRGIAVETFLRTLNAVIEERNNAETKLAAIRDAIRASLNEAEHHIWDGHIGIRHHHWKNILNTTNAAQEQGVKE